MVRRRSGIARGPAEGVPPLRRDATRARRATQAHHPARARPVRRAAGRARVPAGAERRRASARRGLVAGGTRAGPDRARAGRRVITRDTDAFFAFARRAAADFGPATARAAFLVA